MGNSEAGKLADIVILDANPLDNIANALATWQVVVGGKGFAEPQPTATNNDAERCGASELIDACR